MQKQRQRRREGRRSALIGYGDDGGVPVDRRAGHPEGLGDLGGALAARYTDPHLQENVAQMRTRLVPLPSQPADVIGLALQAILQLSVRRGATGKVGLDALTVRTATHPV